jgi:hypothetical protein
VASSEAYRLRVSRCHALCWKFSKRRANWSGSKIRGSVSRSPRAEVDQGVARYDDGDLVLVEVLKLGDVLGVGESPSVHDDLSRVEVFVHCGAAALAAARAVEAQSPCHDRSLRRGIGPPSIARPLLADLRRAATFVRKLRQGKRQYEKT